LPSWISGRPGGTSDHAGHGDAIASPVPIYAFKSSGIRGKKRDVYCAIRPGKLAIPSNLGASQKERTHEISPKLGRRSNLRAQRRMMELAEDAERLYLDAIRR
jgi:hypothetical protein